MLKTVFLTAAAALILAGAALTTVPAPAEAKSYCEARADALYPHNKNAHKAYKKRCKDYRRDWKKRHDKGIWIIL